MRTSLVCALVALAAANNTGCKKSGESQGGAASTSLTIAGSNSMLPLAEEWAEAYMAKNPGKRVAVQGGGSASGVKAALTGSADIGNVSRDLHTDEVGLVPTTIARDGISVIVNQKSPVTGLTMAQVKGIFTGTIKNWKDVGGPDHIITVISREEGSGARASFEEIALDKAKVNNTAIVQASTGGIREMVRSDESAIAFITMGQMSGDVRALKIDGVDATEQNVGNNTYRIAHPFNMVTKGAPAGQAKVYLDFLLSPEGQAMVKKQGLIPIK